MPTEQSAHTPAPILERIHRHAFEYEYEYEYRFTEYEYDRARIS